MPQNLRANCLSWRVSTLSSSSFTNHPYFAGRNFWNRGEKFRHGRKQIG
jgi:hypothetical protein